MAFISQALINKKSKNNAHIYPLKLFPQSPRDSKAEGKQTLVYPRGNSQLWKLILKGAFQVHTGHISTAVRDNSPACLQQQARSLAVIKTNQFISAQTFTDSGA